MSTDAPQDLKRPIVVLVKIGYYEITTFIAISVAFWLCTIPLVTIGATLLALLDIAEAIYCGVAPRSERGRIRYFSRSIRENLVRGIPLTVLILFIFTNTFWYFSIALSGQALYHLIGGLAGIHACILTIMLSFRIANILSRREIGWQAAIRSAATSWTDHPHFTVLQISIAAITLLASFVVPVVLVVLFPTGLALFEVIFYRELIGINTQTILVRYEGVT